MPQDERSEKTRGNTRERPALPAAAAYARPRRRRLTSELQILTWGRRSGHFRFGRPVATFKLAFEAIATLGITEA